MKSVARLKSIVKNLSSVTGNTCTQQYVNGEGWELYSCMEDVKYGRFRGAWIKPPKTCNTFPPMAQLKKYKAILNSMVGHKLAVEYKELAMFIPKSLAPMQRYLALCQWRAMWHRPGYVYLFNHYVEHGIDPFYAMFILQSNYCKWTKVGGINMPMPYMYKDVGDCSLLTRWKQAWQHNELINIESCTNSYGSETYEIKDLYDIEGSIKPFIKENSKPIPDASEMFKHSVGDVVTTTFAGLTMRVEILSINNVHLNPYRGDVRCERISSKQIFYIPIRNFA